MFLLRTLIFVFLLSANCAICDVDSSEVSISDIGFPSFPNSPIRAKQSSESSVHVIANAPEAIFFLRSAKDSQAWKGVGREYVFSGLSSGTYTLSFSTENPDYFIPPKEIHFYLNRSENKEIKVTFQIAGKLVINTNLEHSQVLIKPLNRHQNTNQDEMMTNTKTYTLPEGKYLIRLFQTPSQSGRISHFIAPEPVEIEVKAFQTEELSMTYHEGAALPPAKQPRTVVTSNIPMASFTLYTTKEDTDTVVGHYSGKFVQLNLSPDEHYKLVFDEVPSYRTPDPIELQIDAKIQTPIRINYTSLQETVRVPAGKAIIGDAGTDEKINELPAKIVMISAFDIGTYEVTNAQFASWLNQASKEGTISYITEPANHGEVVNNDGELVFKTFENDPFSQISTQSHSTDNPTFTPLPGKDSFPVINVSWLGAKMYCQDNKCRLPTEAEWEKAAGMDQTPPNTPLKKFRFGFGKDEIDSSWANYKSDEIAALHFQVLTTPVGFYNGMNFLPLSVLNKNQIRTHLAISPYGAYDMSGNVWEWVEDWYDSAYYKNMSDVDPQGPVQGTERVAKGGCYASFANGVRVSERLGLPLNYADPYTGFRVARDVKPRASL